MKLMPHCRNALMIAVPLLALSCAGPPPPPPPAPVVDTGPWLGDRLTAAMISERISGRTLYGCLADGAPWAERLSADGSFQDMGQEARTMGRWYVTPLDEICYAYEAGPNAGQAPFCFIVSETRDGLHFYEAATDRYAASTACPMRPAG